MAAPPKPTADVSEAGVTARVTAKTGAKRATAPKAVPAGEVIAKAASAAGSVPARRAAAKPKSAAVPKPGKAVSPVADAPGKGAASEPAVPPLRRKDIVDHVKGATGARRKHVKQIVSHTLKVLGDLIARGEQAGLHALLRSAGKAKSGDTGNGVVVARAAPESGAARARRATAKPLAEPAAES